MRGYSGERIDPGRRIEIFENYIHRADILKWINEAERSDRMRDPRFLEIPNSLSLVRCRGSGLIFFRIYLIVLDRSYIMIIHRVSHMISYIIHSSNFLLFFFK